MMIVTTDETIPIIISDVGANLAIAASPLNKGHAYATILKIGTLKSDIEPDNKNKIGETTVKTLLFVIMAIITTIDIVATLYNVPIPIILIKYNIFSIL